MSISKHLLALALGACLAAPAFGAGKPHRGVSARAHERPGHSRGRGHLSRDRGGQTAGALRAAAGANARRCARAPIHGSPRAASTDPVTGLPLGTRQQFEQDTTRLQREPHADRFSIGASTRRWSRPTSASCAPRPISRRRSRISSCVSRRAYFNVLAAEDNLASAVAAARERFPAARAVATALRGRLDRDHGRAAIAGRLRRCRRARDRGAKIAVDGARAAPRDRRRDRRRTSRRRRTTSRC